MGGRRNPIHLCQGADEMTFQASQPIFRASPGFPIGLAVSFCVVAATLVSFAALALTGVGLIEW
jgi:hypothetical protein